MRRTGTHLAIACAVGAGAALATTLPLVQAGRPAAGAPSAQATGDETTGEQSTPADDEPIRTVQEREYFVTADYDANGWISFREAEQALLLDRDEFGRYDTDKDGRISQSEFGERYRLAIERVGGFQPPVPPADAVVAPARGPDQLRNAYDADLNGALDLAELKILLGDYDVPEVDPALALSQLDANDSNRLELNEIQFLTSLLDTLRTSPVHMFGAEATTLEGLFGVQVPRPAGLGEVPMPPRISGPIPPFTRLDLDGDGGITVEDLTALEFPMTLPVRPATVVASLDLDGDGALSTEELSAALGGRRP